MKEVRIHLQCTYPGEVLNHNILDRYIFSVLSTLGGIPWALRIRYAGPSHFLCVGDFSTWSPIYLIRIFLTIKLLHLEFLRSPRFKHYNIISTRVQRVEERS